MGREKMSESHAVQCWLKQIRSLTARRTQWNRRLRSIGFSVPHDQNGDSLQLGLCVRGSPKVRDKTDQRRDQQRSVIADFVA